MLDVLLRSHEEFLGRKPKIRPNHRHCRFEGLPTQKEFELFKEYFESQGYPALICSQTSWSLMETIALWGLGN